ncbi:hypothetical protein ACFFX0_12895 [Citricoccus parietis]|uniref:Uncharacterized protein n=1 Tax=Citricoccus parietis TaxID=592307 RepID=A0ABV5FZF2_9MICC
MPDVLGLGRPPYDPPADSPGRPFFSSRSDASWLNCSTDSASGPPSARGP